MGADLDLYDVAADHPVAMRELTELLREIDLVRDLLNMVYSRWDSGESCYDDEYESKSYVGNAVRLEPDEQDQIIAAIQNGGEHGDTNKCGVLCTKCGVHSPGMTSCPGCGKTPRNVREIVVAWLRSNGYDGLYSDECGCRVDDLMPCDDYCLGCEPGYLMDCDAETCAGGGGCEWHIGPRPKEGDER